MEDDQLLEDLLFAIREGRLEDVDRRIKPSNFSKKKIQDCFYAAVFYNQTDIATLFLQRHLNFMSKDKMSPPLYLAAHHSNLKIVELLLEKGANIDNFLVSPLLDLAIKTANNTVIEQILKRGISVHSKVRGALSSIHIAIEECSLKTIECLLTNGADANATYDGRRLNCTLLHHAVESGKEDVVQILLKHGARVDAKASDDSTPICVAVEKGYEKIARLLIQAGADVNSTFKRSVNNGQIGEAKEASTANEWSLLQIATEKGYEGIVKLLLESNAKITSVNGKTLAQIAAEKGYEKIVKLLQDHATETAAETSANGSPLHEVSAQGCLEQAEVMLKGGAVVDSKNDNGRTPLFLAAKNGHEEMVRLLVKNGANIDYTNEKGWTPLHYFSTDGLKRAVECLLKCNASVNSKDSKGRTALYFAAQRGQVDTIKLLLKYGAKIDVSAKDGTTPLIISALKGKTEAVAVLLQAGAKVGSKKVEKILYDLLEKGRNEELKLLLKYGAKFGTYEGDTQRLNDLLRDQAERGNVEIVEALRKSGAHPNSTGDEMPLVQAADKIFKLLLDSGAESGPRCETALLRAIRAPTPNLKSIKVLLEQGAQVDRVSLCAAAERYWLPEILQLLLEYGSVDANMVPEDHRHNLFEVVNKLGSAVQNCQTIPAHGVSTAEVLVKHLIKMRSLFVYRGKDNFKAVTYCDEAVMGNFKVQCMNEFLPMTKTNVPGTNDFLCFLNVLVRHPHDLALYFPGVRTVRSIRPDYLKKEFPMYANYLAYKLEKVMIRMMSVQERRKNNPSVYELWRS